MTFTENLWEQTKELRRKIDELPFVRGIKDGSLAQERFDYYMTQDAIYLADYGRALAGLAQRATQAEDLIFWARCAANTIEVERQLHASHVDVHAEVQMSPTCRAYTSFLLSTQVDSYAVAASAMLPCFWIYEDVGSRFLSESGDLENHPYGDWIRTYADPTFASDTVKARQIIDRLAEECGPREQQRMYGAFVQAVRYEWMFWDAAWRMEEWPI